MNQILQNEIDSLGEDLVLELIVNYKLEQLDKGDPFDAIRRQTPLGELPACCQGLYHYDDVCEHWDWRNGRYYNLVTGKYADDKDYVNYMENQ